MSVHRNLVIMFDCLVILLHKFDCSKTYSKNVLTHNSFHPIEISTPSEVSIIIHLKVTQHINYESSLLNDTLSL